MSGQRMITKEQFDALIQKARMVKGPTREIFAKLAWNELPSAPSVECEKCKAMLDKVKTFHGKITGREGMTFEQFFTESYRKWWNKIHALPEVGGKEEGNV